MEHSLTAYFEDLARAASLRGGTRFSRFLDPAEALRAREAARRLGVQVALWGGFSEAERAVAAFYACDAPDEWPICCLKATWSARAAAPEHRDLLGAQMALGLDRGCFGDIVAGGDAAYLFLDPKTAGYVLANFAEAGRVKLTLEALDGPPAELPRPQGRPIRVTLGSMRLDALVAAAWNLSRAEAQEMIGRELVKRNHVPCPRPDARVEAGDLLSARGLGRARVLSAPQPTRKGRVAVELFLYGNN